MATQADSSSALSPEVVGNAFVEQYYSILCQSPDHVHRFYHESSMLSRPDSSGAMTLVTTIKDINDKILSMEYQKFKVQIFSADAQASYNDGLIVLVTGCLLGKDNLGRKFTQSFFLAPQDKGYFVLNDVFRYVDEMEDKGESKGVVNNKADEIAPRAPLAAAPAVFAEPTHAPANHVVNHAIPENEDGENSKEASHPLGNGKVLVTEKMAVPEHIVVSSQSDASLVTKTPASKTQDEVPKKSFASVVHDLKKSNSPFNVVVRAPPVKPVEQMWGTAAAAVETASNGNGTMEKTNNNAVKGHSIFVGNLPETATVGQLKVIFEQFGPIKPDGIRVRSQKQTGNCFGFVEFESASSVQSVLKASPLLIGNRRASIEVKRGNSDGGKFPSSQGGYRDNNFRRPWNFNESRGYRRNEYEKRGEYADRARGSSNINGGANPKGNEIGGKVAPQGGAK
ncbi:nuclear transport factor 2-like isoform X2 [Mangifera indica]|uniref:nuclear transport factor 2-like isoform X2 n=1 Tax=Mangifera indica TaxID=29780 RepID=UPI001CFA2FED|nr:nuclear transport factor 2-like isoform X2 [Mangifera indica]